MEEVEADDEGDKEVLDDTDDSINTEHFFLNIKPSLQYTFDAITDFVLPGSAHAIISIGDTEIGFEGSAGSNVTTTVVPSSVTGISTVPSSLGLTVVVVT